MGVAGRLFCFGYGASAQALAERARSQGWEVAGTSRDGRDVAGMETIRFDGTGPMEKAHERLAKASHLLVSIPPGEEGDVVLQHHSRPIAACAESLGWVGYLSTTGVYGNHDGAWVDETTPCAPISKRGRRRCQAEEAWARLGEKYSIAVHIFRLAGIYGPGRNPFVRIREGCAQRISKPGQLFSRIHVADIAAVLEASIRRPRAGAVYNVCDDEPAPPGEVIAFAAELLGAEPPPEVSLKEANLSEMGRSFYAENKKVSNRLLKEELKVTLAYPTYREGLRGCLSAENV